MMETGKNLCEVRFLARSENEAFARMAAAAFVMPLNPTVEEITDIKTAVSEAVTNAILHGYNQDAKGMVTMQCEREGRRLTFVITDEGIGIENVKRAMEPWYTSKPELERSGMGFSFMEAFMDSLTVESSPGAGCKVTMEKYIGPLGDGKTPETE